MGLGEVGAMRRVGLVLLAVLALTVGGLVAGAGLVLNSAPVRERLAEAVQRATGHPLRLGGGLGVAWSLTPALAVRDAALLNGAGFSRPEFAMVRRIEASVALLPLLSGRVEVRTLTIEGADVLLERDASGRGNWQRPVAAVAAPGKASAHHAAPVAIGHVQLDDARVALLGGPALDIRSLGVSPAGGPITGSVALNGVALKLKGQSGAMTAAPFPLEVSAAGGGLTIAVTGQVGGVLDLRGAAPDLAAASTLAGRALPSLRDVQVSGRIAADGAEDLHLTVGDSDLGAVLPGLRLMGLTATAPGPGQPVQVLAQGMLRGLPLAGGLTMPRLPMQAGPAPFQLTLTTEGGSASASGSLDRGWEAVVSAKVADLQALGVKAGIALPSVHDAALDLRVLPAPEGDRVLLRGIRLSMRQGDVAGDLSVGLSPRPSVKGTLETTRIDLDDWAAPVVPASTPGAAAPAAQPAAPAETGPRPLFSTRPLPFALLRLMDADVRLAVSQAMLHGAVYRAIGAQVVLQDGKLRLDQAQMRSPGGVVQARLQADATVVPPLATLAVMAPGLDAGGLAMALGLAEGAAAGSVDVDMEVRTAGADPHTMAATLGGHLGLALVDGEVDNQALFQVLGVVLRGVNLPFDKGGRSRVRCLATRIDAVGGQATVRTLALDTTRLRLEGDGLLDLGNETMDLHMRPVIRMGGTLGALGGGGVSVPVRLIGPFRAPHAQADRGVVQPGRFGITIGAPSSDPCGAALAAARDGRAGPAPMAAP
jgi:uncharacterized protein involved in outer membrane biogenesis